MKSYFGIYRDIRFGIYLVSKLAYSRIYCVFHLDFIVIFCVDFTRKCSDNFLCFITSIGCDVNILCWNIILPNLEYCHTLPRITRARVECLFAKCRSVQRVMCADAIRLKSRQIIQ